MIVLFILKCYIFQMLICTVIHLINKTPKPSSIYEFLKLTFLPTLLFYLVKDMKIFKKFKRKLKEYYNQRYRDIILTITGKNFVTVRGYCFHCKQSYHIEFHKNFKLPLRSRCGCKDCDNFDMMCFNDYNYYPPLTDSLDKRVVENAKEGI